jgi:hypothetical protein
MGFGNYGEGASKSERQPAPKLGTHRIVIDTFEAFKTQDFGIVPRVKYRIKSSRADTIGAVRGDVWFINNQGWPGKYNLTDFWGFMAAVVGSLGGNPTSMQEKQQTSNELAEIDPNGALAPSPERGREYPGRGIELEVRAWLDEWDDKKTGERKSRVKCSYEAVEQTEEDIARNREWIESGAADASAGDADQEQDEQPAAREQPAPRKSLLKGKPAGDVPF